MARRSIAPNVIRATRGHEAIELHPDLGRGLEFEYAASDVIADLLHAVADYYRRNAGGDPSQLVHEVYDRALRTYEEDE
jgi:hypothetical protein